MFRVDVTCISELNDNCAVPTSVGVLDCDHFNSEKCVSRTEQHLTPLLLILVCICSIFVLVTCRPSATLLNFNISVKVNRLHHFLKKRRKLFCIYLYNACIVGDNILK